MKRFIKIGLPICCLLALYLFLNSLRINAKREQLRLEREKLALNFVNHMNSAQQKYFNKHQKFADSLEELGLNAPRFKILKFEYTLGPIPVMFAGEEIAKCVKHRFYIKESSGSQVLNYAKVQSPGCEITEHYYTNYIGGVFAVNLENKTSTDNMIKFKYVTIICEYSQDFSSPRYDYERDEASCGSVGTKVTSKN